MKKKYIAVLAAGAAVGIWYTSRDKKYLVCRELRFLNKLLPERSTLANMEQVMEEPLKSNLG